MLESVLESSRNRISKKRELERERVRESGDSENWNELEKEKEG